MIFAAAAVMVAVFFTFAVMLRLLGRRAWYLPKPLHRVLPDVRFGHAA